MKPERSEESGEMYSPDEQGEYVPEEDAPYFYVQGLTDTLTEFGQEVTEVQPAVREYAMLLEVMMADCLGCPHPPAFSWNVGMVMHVLKSDPILRDLKQVQVDGPRMAYLFFYNKQGRHSCTQETAQVTRTHVLRVDLLLCTFFHKFPSAHGSLAPHHGSLRAPEV